MKNVAINLLLSFYLLIWFMNKMSCKRNQSKIVTRSTPTQSNDKHELELFFSYIDISQKQYCSSKTKHVEHITEYPLREFIFYLHVDY